MKIIHYNYPSRGIRIEAGPAGTLESDNLLVKTLATQLESQGYNIQSITLHNGDKIITFNHEFDNIL